jgi:AcrR family transcriptional regulator
MAGGARTSADSVLATLLAGGATRANAAKQAGVSEATVYRRLKDDGFQDQIEELRAEMVDQVVGLLTRASPAAVAKLIQLMTSGKSETVQFNSACKLIELGFKTRENEEVEARLEALEQERLPPTSARSRWTA